MRANLCFDLDGTLTDPAEGITLSIQYGLQQMRRPVPAQSELLACIGPPIQSNFALLLQTDDAQTVQTAVKFYRERYSDGGLFENRVYPGIDEMLTQLHDAGRRLFVATSKPTVYAGRILEHFGLDRYFVAVYGSELDATRTDKSALLAHLLDCERISAETAAMVGDRKHDILGARANRLSPIGVSYGFGSVEELTAAGAEVVCHGPSEIAALNSL